MSNKASSNLHSLIRSMSKAEKRYFKLYSSRHTLGEKNNYSILFDAIDKQDEYDEEKLMKKFKGEAFTNRFSISKRRLYEAVLKSLDAFYSNSSVDEKIRRMLHYSEILYDRSLYDQSEKILQSARKMASKHERWNALMEISDKEKALNEKYSYSGGGKLDPEALREQDIEALSRMEQYSSLWKLKSDLFTDLYQKGTVRSEGQKKALDELVLNECSDINPDELAPRALYLYHHVHSAYYFSSGNHSMSLEHLEKNFKLIRTQHEPFKEPQNVYLSVLTNLIYMYHRTGSYAKAITYLGELKKMPEALELTLNEDLKVRMFTSVKSVELTLFLLNKDYDRALRILPEVEVGLNEFGDRISKVRRASFYYLMATILFHTGDHSASLKWVNRLLNDLDIDESAETHCFAQLLYMLLHLELNNKDLLPYAIRSTQRYLKTRDRTYKFETLLLEFINTMARSRKVETTAGALNVLIKGLGSIKNDPYEAAAFEYFDLLNWANNKLESLNNDEPIERRA